MALPEFIDLLCKSNEINSSEDYYITIQYDSYTKHFDTPGRYHLILAIKNGQGETFTKQLEIRVIEKPVDYIYTGIIPDAIEQPTWIQKYVKYFVGGGISLAAIVSNIVWIVLFRKK